MQQFQFQKVLLIKAINSHLKNVEIKDIRFVLPQDEKREEPEEQKVQFVAPPPDLVRKFEEQASFIEDDETRESLIRFWYLAKACVRK